MEIPRHGVKLELQLEPVPQPQQHQIWAASVTYAAACGNAGSLTLNEAMDWTHILTDTLLGF